MEASSQQIPPPPTPPQQQQPQMPPPPQQPGMVGGPQHTGRGGRGRGGNNNGGGRGNRGGRTASGGRSILNVNGRGQGQRGGGRGRGGPSPQGGQVQKVSANSGIPFGHVPAYLPGSSSLVEELDQRIMIVLRDGRHLVGNLRTFDQYSNLVLDNASERRFHSNEKETGDGKNVTYYTDVPLGMYIVRGDSIVLLGQVGSEEEEEASEAAATASPNSIVTMKKLETSAFEDLVASSEEPEESNDAEQEGAEGSKSLEWDFDKDLLA